MDNNPSNKKGIKSWAADDRPREKMERLGAIALSDAELIAIIFANGTKDKSAVDLSRELLATAANDLNRLARLSLKDFQKINGIGPAKAIALMACLELGRRRKNRTDEELVFIKDSHTAFELLYLEMKDLIHEVFCVLFLNQSNKVLHKEVISKGGMTGTVVDVRLLVKLALDHRACNLIIAHNHPSYNLQPSKSDINITHQIKEATALFNISLFDHLIIAGSKYYSFADNGLL